MSDEFTMCGRYEKLSQKIWRENLGVDEEHNEINVKELSCNGVEYFWIQTSGGLLCAGNGPLGSIKVEEF
jgi:hypothetical protein